MPVKIRPVSRPSTSSAQWAAPRSKPTSGTYTATATTVPGTAYPDRREAGAGRPEVRAVGPLADGDDRGGDDGDGRRQQPQDDRVPHRATEVRIEVASRDRLHRPGEQLGDGQRERHQQEDESRQGGEPAPGAAERPGRDGVAAAEGLVVAGPPAQRPLEGDHHQGEAHEHGGELQRCVLVEGAVPDPVDDARQRLDARAGRRCRSRPAPPSRPATHRPPAPGGRGGRRRAAPPARSCCPRQRAASRA